MDFKQIQDLIKLVNKSHIGEVSIEQKDFKITIKQKQEPAPPPMYSAPVGPPPAYAPLPPSLSPAGEKKGEEGAPKNDDHIMIKSPMIGTFYRQAGPDKPLFVSVGDVIEKGQVVCIIEAFAQRLQGFGVNIIAYDKYKSGFGNDFVKEVDLPTFFKETDVLSIHLPLTKETTFMVNGAFLNQFEKDIYLINTARGKNIKTSDLIKAIESGKVLGACLDVLEYEKSSFESLKATDLPADFQYLSQCDKVILSPHVAGWTKESYVKLSTTLADKILAVNF